jgi:hypothetical protein
MKVIILSVGLFCLLFFKSEGITTTQNSQNISFASETHVLETGFSNLFWDIAYAKHGIFASTDEQLSLQKKRNTETNPKFSNIQKKYTDSLSFCKLVASSKINLFLIFHHSLSLLQVFLQ